MIHEEFQPGKVMFSMEELSEPRAIEPSRWHDGYLAFSSEEFSLEEIVQRGIDIDGLLKNAKIEGIDGYLMELDLWRSDGDLYEELYMERTDMGWYIFTVVLDTKAPRQEANCYWRRANTSALKSIEVVVPQWRLHFFITTSERREAI